ncbi:MAG: TRZ/ATZ family protein [Firmicutes bacterium]|nr:TRZ/ATZ family protein [Bacillota bacterium]
MAKQRLRTPLTDHDIKQLEAGERLLLSGEIFTARDAACQRLVRLLAAGTDLPIKLAGATIYFTGPSPARPGQITGSIGPTTSGRMDPYTPQLFAAGLKAIIGKGPLAREVVHTIAAHHAIYLAAIGGAGALIARSVREAAVVAYPELGPEAIRRLVVEDLPLIVAVDPLGNDLYAIGRKHYLAQHYQETGEK